MRVGMAKRKRILKRAMIKKPTGTECCSGMEVERQISVVFSLKDFESLLQKRLFLDTCKLNPSVTFDASDSFWRHHRFGKGVYFADASSKSLGYTYHHLSDNTGLLLLCEVATKPVLELDNAAYNADELCKNANAL